MRTSRTLLLLTFLLIIIEVSLPAQDIDIDNWRNVLEKPDSEEKAMDLYDVGREMLKINFDTSRVIFEKMGEVCKSINFQKGYYKYVNFYSYILAQQGNLTEAISLNKEALKLARDNGDSSRVAIIQASLGNSYTHAGLFKNAITSYNNALNYQYEQNDTSKIVYLYNSLAFCYNNMGSNLRADSLLAIKSIEYRHKAIKLAQLQNDSSDLLNSYKGIAVTFSNLEIQDSSLYYCYRAMELAKALGEQRFLAEVMGQLSNTLYLIGDYDEAYEILVEAQPLIDKVGSYYLNLRAKRNLANILEARGDHEKAFQYFQEAIDFAESYEIATDMEQLYIGLSHNAAEVGDYKTAYISYHNAMDITDSIMGMELKKEILDLQSKYDTAQKDNKILELSLIQTKKNRLIIGLALLSAIVALLGFYYFKRYQYKSRIAEQEQEKLKQQSKLEVSSSIIESQENERRRIAQDLHDGLGGILSSVKYSLSEVDENFILDQNGMETFSNALNQLDLAISEMRKVAHNMMPESLVKFGLDDAINDLTSSISQSSSMDFHYSSYGYVKQKQPIEITLYRIVQEALNNALKHSKASDVYVQLNYEDGLITLSIEDNGDGIESGKKDPDGMGLQGIKNRVAYLNGKIDISSDSGNGTIIVIEIEGDEYIKNDMI